jgi:hypothetical protein
VSLDELRREEAHVSDSHGVDHQPLWTILSVSLALLVVYALATYGGRQVPGTPARA